MTRKRKISVVLVVILLLATVLIGTSSYFISPVNSKKTTSTSFTITEGQTANDILKNLEKENLIKSKTFAKLYLKVNSSSFDPVPGIFQLSESDSMSDIFKILSSSKESAAGSVLFLEGFRVIDFAAEAEKKLGIPKKDFLAACNDQAFIDQLKQKYELIKKYNFNPKAIYQLEGLLAPDTYNLTTIKDAKSLIDILVNQSNEKYLKNISLFNKSKLSLNEVYTLASIVEAEAKTYKDRVLVASIFMNRIKNNESLGSDVTTYYGLQIDMASRDLTKAELANNDGYNTRSSMKGLPVGPINSPSNESILAALNYTETEYKYFVSDKNGRIYAAKTYKRHKEIIEKLKERKLWFTY